MNMKGSRSGCSGRALATCWLPVSWGTTYVTVTELLPSGRPMFVATCESCRRRSGWCSLPAPGRRCREVEAAGEPSGCGPRYSRSFNFGIFFPLLIVAVYRLPGGVAAAVGGLQPLTRRALSWLSAARRARGLASRHRRDAAVGVALVVVRPGAGIEPLGPRGGRRQRVVRGRRRADEAVPRADEPVVGDRLAAARRRRGTRAARPRRRRMAAPAHGTRTWSGSPT